MPDTSYPISIQYPDDPRKQAVYENACGMWRFGRITWGDAVDTAEQMVAEGWRVAPADVADPPEGSE